MAYVLIVASALLISSQFIFQAQYQKSEGNDLRSSMFFSFFVYLLQAVVMVAYIFIRGQVPGFTPFSALLAFAFAASALGISYVAVKGLAIGDVALFSLFNMLGSMLLPSLYGIIFAQEGVSVPKAVCIVLVIAALLVECKPTAAYDRRAVKYYIAAFLFNGTCATLLTVHQSRPDKNVSTESFLLLCAVAAVLLSGLFLGAIALGARKHGDSSQSLRFPHVQSILWSSGYSVVNVGGNLLAMIAMLSLPASVQFPILTGDSIVFTTVFSKLMKNKLGVAHYVAVLLSVAATIVIIWA